MGKAYERLDNMKSEMEVLRSHQCAQQKLEILPDQQVEVKVEVGTPTLMIATGVTELTRDLALQKELDILKSELEELKDRYTSEKNEKHSLIAELAAMKASCVSADGQDKRYTKNPDGDGNVGGEIGVQGMLPLCEPDFSVVKDDDPSDRKKGLEFTTVEVHKNENVGNGVGQKGKGEGKNMIFETVSTDSEKVNEDDLKSRDIDTTPNDSATKDQKGIGKSGGKVKINKAEGKGKVHVTTEELDKSKEVGERAGQNAKGNGQSKSKGLGKEDDPKPDVDTLATEEVDKGGDVGQTEGQKVKAQGQGQSKSLGKEDDLKVDVDTTANDSSIRAQEGLGKSTSKGKDDESEGKDAVQVTTEEVDKSGDQAKGQKVKAKGEGKSKSLGKENDTKFDADQTANDSSTKAQKGIGKSSGKGKDDKAEGKDEDADPKELPLQFRPPTSEELLDEESGFLRVIEHVKSILDEENQIEEEIKHFPRVEGDHWFQPVDTIQKIGVAYRKLVSVLEELTKQGSVIEDRIANDCVWKSSAGDLDDDASMKLMNKCFVPSKAGLLATRNFGKIRFGMKVTKHNNQVLPQDETAS